MHILFSAARIINIISVVVRPVPDEVIATVAKSIDLQPLDAVKVGTHVLEVRVIWMLSCFVHKS